MPEVGTRQLRKRLLCEAEIPLVTQLGSGSSRCRPSKNAIFSYHSILSIRPIRGQKVKILANILALALGLMGLVAVIAAGQGNFIPRLVAGLVFLGAAAALVVLSRLQPEVHHHVQEMKVDLSGDVSLEQIQCKQCGAELSSKSVQMAEGAIFVKCEYCNAQYQLEEQAKW